MIDNANLGDDTCAAAANNINSDAIQTESETDTTVGNISSYISTISGHATAAGVAKTAAEAAVGSA